MGECTNQHEIIAVFMIILSGKIIGILYKGCNDLFLMSYKY